MLAGHDGSTMNAPPGLAGVRADRARARLAGRLEAAGIADARVLDALRAVPRHRFVDEALASRAYDETALPIGHGQTISHPLTVARMSEALCAGGRPARVLEVGTGSGYQTAMLAHLCEVVYSVERNEALLGLARVRLRKLGLRNVRLKHTDGGWGWPEQAPFEGILVAAAPDTVPEALIEQLAPGGRMIIPLGAGDVQELALFLRRTDGRIERRVLDRARFVPMRSGVV